MLVASSNVSPTFFGETLVTVARDYTAIEPYTGNQEIDSRLGFPNPFHGFGFPRLPYTLNTSTSTAISYDSCCNPNITYTHYYNIDQNFTFTRVYSLEDGTKLADLKSCSNPKGSCKVLGTANGQPITSSDINPNFGQPTAYQAPRSIRLGAKISF